MGLTVISATSGLTALAFYYSWWFQDSRLTSLWLAAGLVAAVFYGLLQIVCSWLVYLKIQYRSSISSSPTSDLTVDVFVTACGEEHSLIEKCLAAACEMEGDHRTWLLDDGRDSSLPDLAAKLGAEYLTRPDNKNAKAGNINAALARTKGDIIAIFDIDHVPRTDFLQRTIDRFSDAAVGFVQVMITFYNCRQGWVARAASETALDFYNPISRGMDGLNSVTKMGTNCLIRRKALESIGGYQPGLAEDLSTSIALHAAGWRSAYVAEPLAPGLAPPTLSAWFVQQFKWARGVFEILLTAYPRLFRRLTWGQRISYSVRMTKYLVGPIIFVHIVVLIVVMWSGSQVGLSVLQDYYVHLFPIAFVDHLIRWAALHRWLHPDIPHESLWRAIILVIVSWPVYTLAWALALFRLPLSFKPTPKSSTAKVFPLWIAPQLASGSLLMVGMFYTIFVADSSVSFLLLYIVTLTFSLPQLSLLKALR